MSVDLVSPVGYRESLEVEVVDATEKADAAKRVKEILAADLARVDGELETSNKALTVVKKHFDDTSMAVRELGDVLNYFSETPTTPRPEPTDEDAPPLPPPPLPGTGVEQVNVLADSSEALARSVYGIFRAVGENGVGNIEGLLADWNATQAKKEIVDQPDEKTTYNRLKTEFETQLGVGRDVGVDTLEKLETACNAAFSVFVACERLKFRVASYQMEFGEVRSSLSDIKAQFSVEMTIVENTIASLKVEKETIKDKLKVASDAATRSERDRLIAVNKLSAVVLGSVGIPDNNDAPAVEV